MIFLTLVGRPVSVAALLAGFRASIGQMGLVSWAGLRRLLPLFLQSM